MRERERERERERIRIENSTKDKAQERRKTMCNAWEYMNMLRVKEIVSWVEIQSNLIALTRYNLSHNLKYMKQYYNEHKMQCMSM